MAVPKEIIDLIRFSGNNFHAKVARWFLEKGWHVEVSPYYMDQTQGKAREIDLIVEKIVGEIHQFPDQLTERIAIRLYIECKFVASNSVFWFAEKDKVSAHQLVCKEGNFRHNNSYTNEHHYLINNRVAKVFATASNKNSENEPFYKALNQTLNGMVSMRGRVISIPGVAKSKIPIRTLEFPVVVCSSFASLYFVDFFSESTPQPIVDNFQLELRYAYVDRAGNSLNDYFLLDFIAMDNLEAFISAIDHDAMVLKILSSN
jgi:hypothetical protein